MGGSLKAPSVALQRDENLTLIEFKSADGTTLNGRIIHVKEPPGMFFRVVIDSDNYFDVSITKTGFHPYPYSQLDLGTAVYRWKDLYLVNSPIVGSDRRIKKDITPLEISLIIKLLMSIPAVQYRLIDGDSGRIHYGFIAQDVENALTEAEITTMDFAGFIKSPVVDEKGNETDDYIYALRLEEFIPILWAHQQDVERRLQAAGL